MQNTVRLWTLEHDECYLQFDLSIVQNMDKGMQNVSILIRPPLHDDADALRQATRNLCWVWWGVMGGGRTLSGFGSA